MKTARDIGILVVGWALIVTGAIGIFLPFLQGILLIGLGCAILSSRSETFKKGLARLKEKFPYRFTRVNTDKKV